MTDETYTLLDESKYDVERAESVASHPERRCTLDPAGIIFVAAGILYIILFIKYALTK